jgi:hypothetical protein
MTEIKLGRLVSLRKELGCIFLGRSNYEKL